MNIFLAFLQSPHSYPIPAYSFWEYYIKNGIEEAGLNWSECPGADWALGLVPREKPDFEQWKAEIWSRTVEWLRKNPADLFLSYLYPHQVDPSAIREIQRLGIPCVNFFCDHVRDFDKIPAAFGVFDLNWVPEYKAVQLYHHAGFAFMNLPMPMWVEPKYRKFTPETRHQVTFIGSKDIQRILLLESVLHGQPDVPLAVYGNGWKENDIPATPNKQLTIPGKIKFNLGFIQEQGITSFLRKIRYRHMTYAISDALSAKTCRSPSFDVYNELTAASMITLGINRYESLRFPLHDPDSYSKLRDIEAPMLGACYLTEYTEGIGELYDIETEITVYKNAEELIGKINELQADPAKRKKQKLNGQKKALNEHNIPSSLNKIVKKVMH